MVNRRVCWKTMEVQLIALGEIEKRTMYSSSIEPRWRARTEKWNNSLFLMATTQQARTWNLYEPHAYVPPASWGGVPAGISEGWHGLIESSSLSQCQCMHKKPSEGFSFAGWFSSIIARRELRAHIFASFCSSYKVFSGFN